MQIEAQLRAEFTSRSPTNQSPRQSSFWSLPSASHFKINFDASVSRIHQVIGIGVVIHNYDGQFIAGLSKKMHLLTSAELAEVLAARGPVLLGKRLMIPSFILEGDASSVIKQISSSDEILSDLGTVIEDIHISLLDQHIVDVAWIPRDANKVAYSLADFA